MASLVLLGVHGVAWANPVPMFGRVGPTTARGGPPVLIVAVPPYGVLTNRPVVPVGGPLGDGQRRSVILPNTWDLPPASQGWLRPASNEPTAWQSQRTRIEEPGGPVAIEALESSLMPVDSLETPENHLPAGLPASED